MNRDGDFQLVTLPNGTRAVKHSGHGEVMHPATGPWREANQLYVEQSRLAARLSETGGPLCLYDVGMGAATNLVAALTCANSLTARRDLKVFSFERDLAPLRLALSDEGGFPFLADYREPLLRLMECGSWRAPGLSLELISGDAIGGYALAGAPADLVYFDPFSPKANPELWTPQAFRALRGKCAEDATLFTYSAATPTRVSLLLAGFFVGAGDAIGQKRETTVAALKRESLERPLDRRWIERWRRSSARAPHGHLNIAEAELERAIFDHPQFVGGFV